MRSVCRWERRRAHDALTTAEAASVERVRQGYFRPGAHERGLKILWQELLEDRPRRITISRRIATLLREGGGGPQHLVDPIWLSLGIDKGVSAPP
jgi:murein tripeptide amidase MpaA